MVSACVCMSVSSYAHMCHCTVISPHCDLSCVPWTAPFHTHTHAQTHTHTYTFLLQAIIHTHWCCVMHTRRWDPHGTFKALHQMNPARLKFIVSAVQGNLQTDAGGGLRGLHALDVGCGGGASMQPCDDLSTYVWYISMATCVYVCVCVCVLVGGPHQYPTWSCAPSRSAVRATRTSRM